MKYDGSKLQFFKKRPLNLLNWTKGGGGGGGGQIGPSLRFSSISQKPSLETKSLSTDVFLLPW